MYQPTNPLRRSRSERFSSKKNNRVGGFPSSSQHQPSPAAAPSSDFPLLERSNNVMRAAAPEKKTKKRFELRRLLCSDMSGGDDYDSGNNSPRDQASYDESDWEAQHRSCWASFQQTFADDEGTNNSKSTTTPNSSYQAQATNKFKGLTVRLLCRSRAEDDDEEKDLVDVTQRTNVTRSSSSTEDDLSSSSTDLSTSTHTRSTEEDDTTHHHDADHAEEEVIFKPKPHKGLRFADEVGQEIETIHYTDTEYMEPLSVQCIMILLLSPKDRRFELVQVSYHKTKERMTVKDVTRQLPSFAADKVLRGQKYSGLACRRRTSDNAESSTIRTEELLQMLCIQDYDLVKNEVLVALVAGYSSKDLMTMAETLLQNKNVRKAAKSAKRSRRAIQPLHPTPPKKNNHTRQAAAPITPDECEL